MNFKKLRKQVGVFAATVGMAGMLSPASAFELTFDPDEELTGSLNSILSFGAQWRMQERDADIVGKANNNPRFEELGNQDRVNAYMQVPGLWSVNGDDGNLNYDQHDITYAVAKVTSDLNLSYGDFSFKAGWSFYFDEVNRNFKEQRVSRFYLEDNTYDPVRDADCLSDAPANPCIETNRPKEIEDEVGFNFFLYDFNLAYDFEIAEKFVTLRVGRQGVNWGESTFLVLGSINSVNPPNAYRLRIPGGDLKEIFKPLNMVFGSIGLTDNATLEAFYQLEWEPVDPDPVGSFFATSDVAGEGGDFAMLSFVEPEDPNNEKDGAGRGTPPASGGTPGPLPPSGRSTEVIKTNGRLNQFRRNVEAGLEGGCGDANNDGLGTDEPCDPDTLDAQGWDEFGYTTPRDEGQYGVKLAYYAEDLNGGTDLGFYYLNIHSRLPYASLISTVQTAQPAVGPPVVPDVLDNADTLKVFLTYPEDIKYYGMSFSTNVGDWAVSGELVYRPDYPFQIHSTDLTFAALAPAFSDFCLTGETGPSGTTDSANTPADYGECANAAQGRAVNRVSVPSFVEVFRSGDLSAPNENFTTRPRSIVSGYEELDALQYDMTFLALPGTNPFAADTWLVLFETGFTKVMDMPDIDELQFDASGADTHFSRGVNEGAQQNPTLGGTLVQNPEREDGERVFADDFSWGIRFISLLTYNDLLFGFNVEPLTGFFWDINGNSPGPGGNFIEDRKTIFQGIRFNKGNWSGEMRYTWFTGADERNAERDRDNLFLQFTYSF